MTVARKFRRNANTTRITSRTASTKVRSTSCSEVRMVVDRSTASPMSIAGETEARNSGIRPFTASTVEMMLAPGCR